MLREASEEEDVFILTVREGTRTNSKVVPQWVQINHLTVTKSPLELLRSPSEVMF